MPAGKFSVEAIFKAVDRLTQPMRKMQTGIRTFAKDADKAMKQLDGVTSKVLTSVNGLAVGFTALGTAAAAGLAVAAKPGMEFEQKMADLGAAYLMTRDQMGDLEKEALRLGAATQFSGTEIVAAMENMAKAGFEPQQTLRGIAGMTYAAAAAGEDLATTAENVSAVMKGMGIDVGRSTEVADVLALASVKTASSISSLAESMSKVSSTARQLGVPLKDTVAMVALLQDVGLDASEAGSATATMLTMMSKPSDQVAAKMRRLGVSFKDAQGNMKKPVEVLQQLVKAGKKAGGNMDQVAFFADLVGLRGQKAAVNLKELFAAGKYEPLVEALDHAQGTAQKMSDLRMNTLTGDLDVATENVKTLGVELYTMASGPLREIVKGFTEWLDANKGIIVSGIVDTIKAIAANLPTIVKWAKRLGIIVTVLYAAAAAVKVATLAMAAFNAVAALNPIALIAMAVVGAIALILAFWPEVSQFFADMWAGIVQLAGSITAAVSSFVSRAFAPIKAFFLGWFKFVVGIWTLAAQALIYIFKPQFDQLMTIARIAYAVLLAIWGPLSEFFALLWDGIVQVATYSWGLIASVIGGYVERVKSVWSTLGEFFVGLWEMIKSAFLAVLGPVFEKIMWAIGAVQEIGQGTIDTVTGGGAAPQVVSPQERTAQSISQSTETTNAELLIRDDTGKAVMTKAPSSPRIGIRLEPTGAF